MGVPDARSVADPMREAEAALLTGGLRRLVARWRTLAARIEPYAPPAARAYEQAAADLEEELEQHPNHVNALHSFQTAIISALREGRRSGHDPRTAAR